MRTTNTVAALIALAMAAPAALAAGPAQEPKAPAASAPVAAPAPEAKTADTATASSEAADEARLENARGGDAAMSGEANLGGVVSNNSAINVVTGSNLIDSSFTNASGLPMVIQNSGANVLIQNATVINLQIR